MRRAWVLTLLVVVAAAGSATAQVALPDVGVDMTETIPLMVESLGHICAGVIAAFIALHIIAAGLRVLARIINGDG